MTKFTNYYEVLGVSESASPSEITHAYRTLAMKWHPDRYKGEDATEKMTQINEAYCILKDPEARRKFDEELLHFKQFMQQKEKSAPKNTENSYSDNQSPSSAAEEYFFKDKTLEEWVQQAREKGRQVAIQSLKDLGSMSTEAAKGFVLHFLWGGASTFIFIFLFFSCSR